MKKKIHTYEGEEITVRWDARRCLHVGECVRRLPAVFDTSRREWVVPDNAAADEVAATVRACPTGALQYESRSNPNREKPPAENRIVLRPNGPVWISGKIEIVDSEGSTLLEDTRVALCRCGASSNKPLCDNSHRKSGFRAGTDADVSGLPPSEEMHDRIVLKLMDDGPVLVEGTYTIDSASAEPRTCSKTIALCRCGGSKNKPFCDGSHKPIGFRSGT